MIYGMTESFTLISMLIFGAVTKSYITRMFKSNSGEPYAGKLHVRFDEGAGKVFLSFPLYSTEPSGKKQKPD